MTGFADYIEYGLNVASKAIPMVAEKGQTLQIKTTNANRQNTSKLRKHLG